MIIQKPQTTFKANIATLAKSQQAPLLRYSTSAPRGEFADRSIGQTVCGGQRNRLRKAIYIANLVWQHGWSKDKPLPLSPDSKGIPAAWKNFINSVPTTDRGGHIKIGDLLISDLVQWKKTWKALQRSAQIDAKNAALDKTELTDGILPKDRIPSVARYYETTPEKLTEEFLTTIENIHKKQEATYQKRAEDIEDTGSFTYGNLEEALDELQIPKGDLKSRTAKIPFAPYNPKWYSDASLNAGGPIRED